MDVYEGLDDLINASAYWENVQFQCLASGTLAIPAPFYNLPYLQSDRVVVPRGPGMAEDADGFRDYSIAYGSQIYTLVTSGRSRCRVYSNLPEAWFGSFTDSAKYFIANKVANVTRMNLQQPLPVANWAWPDGQLAQGWSEKCEPNPVGFERSRRFFHVSDQQRFYFTTDIDTATTFTLNLSWRELNKMYSRGIPGIEKILMPAFSDDIES